MNDTPNEKEAAAWVFVVHEPEGPRKISVVEGLLFGRDPDCSCSLTDPRASGRHAVVKRVAGDLVVEDVGSTNKTLVYGGADLGRGDSVPVHPGLKFRVGDTWIEVVAPDQFEKTMASPSSGRDVSAQAEDETRRLKAEAKAQAEAEAKARAEAEAKAQAEAEAKAQAEAEAKARAEAEAKAQAEAEAKAQAEAEAKAQAEAEAKARAEAEAKAQAKAQAEAQAEAEAKAEAEAEAKAQAAAEAKAQAEAQAKAQGEANEDARAKAEPAKKAKKGESRAQAMPASEPTAEQAADLENANLGAATVGNFDSEMASIVRIGVLEDLRPRLVLDAPERREILFLEGAEFLIGRGDAHRPQLALEHDRVSGKHARIYLDGRHFFVEDLGSRNKTHLGNEVLAANAPREIHSDTFLRFGPVGALFVTEPDGTDKEVVADDWEAAARLLAERIPIGAQQMADAREEQAAEREAGRRNHIGEILIRHGTVSAQRWSETLEEVRLRRKLGGSASPKSSKAPIVILLVLLAIAATVLGFWRPWD